MPPYRRLQQAASAELREKGSRFLALVEPVERSAQCAQRLDGLRQQYHDATHVCFAWRLADGEQRSSDAGEPAGTAGGPILRALEGEELVDCLAAVVRWYGGTKLGRGGLVRAYAGAVRAALAAAPKFWVWPTRRLEIEATYEQYGAVQRLVRPGEVALTEIRFDQTVAATLEVDERVLARIEDQLSALSVDFRKST